MPHPNRILTLTDLAEIDLESILQYTELWELEPQIRQNVNYEELNTVGIIPRNLRNEEFYINVN